MSGTRALTAPSTAPVTSIADSSDVVALYRNGKFQDIINLTENLPEKTPEQSIFLGLSYLEEKYLENEQLASHEKEEEHNTIARLFVNGIRVSSAIKFEEKEMLKVLKFLFKYTPLSSKTPDPKLLDSFTDAWQKASQLSKQYRFEEALDHYEKMLPICPSDEVKRTILIELAKQCQELTSAGRLLNKSTNRTAFLETGKAQQLNTYQAIVYYLEALNCTLHFNKLDHELFYQTGTCCFQLSSYYETAMISHYAYAWIINNTLGFPTLIDRLLKEQTADIRNPTAYCNLTNALREAILLHARDNKFENLLRFMAKFCEIISRNIGIDRFSPSPTTLLLTKSIHDSYLEGKILLDTFTSSEPLSILQQAFEIWNNSLSAQRKQTLEYLNIKQQLIKKFAISDTIRQLPPQANHKATITHQTAAKKSAEKQAPMKAAKRAEHEKQRNALNIQKAKAAKQLQEQKQREAIEKAKLEKEQHEKEQQEAEQKRLLLEKMKAEKKQEDNRQQLKQALQEKLEREEKQRVAKERKFFEKVSRQIPAAWYREYAADFAKVDPKIAERIIARAPYGLFTRTHHQTSQVLLAEMKSAYNEALEQDRVHYPERAKQVISQLKTEFARCLGYGGLQRDNIRGEKHKIADVDLVVPIQRGEEKTALATLQKLFSKQEIHEFMRKPILGGSDHSWILKLKNSDECNITIRLSPYLSTSVKADADTLDFTMNAGYSDEQGYYLDPTEKAYQHSKEAKIEIIGGLSRLAKDPDIGLRVLKFVTKLNQPMPLDIAEAMKKADYQTAYKNYVDQHPGIVNSFLANLISNGKAQTSLELLANLRLFNISIPESKQRFVVEEIKQLDNPHHTFYGCLGYLYALLIIANLDAETLAANPRDFNNQCEELQKQNPLFKDLFCPQRNHVTQKFFTKNTYFKRYSDAIKEKLTTFSKRVSPASPTQSSSSSPELSSSQSPSPTIFQRSIF